MSYNRLRVCRKVAVLPSEAGQGTICSTSGRRVRPHGRISWPIIASSTDDLPADCGARERGRGRREKGARRPEASRHWRWARGGRARARRAGRARTWPPMATMVGRVSERPQPLPLASAAMSSCVVSPTQQHAPPAARSGLQIFAEQDELLEVLVAAAGLVAADDEGGVSFGRGQSRCGAHTPPYCCLVSSPARPPPAGGCRSATHPPS